MKIRTCVTPEGQFIHGIHRPAFTVRNLRQNDFIEALGSFVEGLVHENRANFPAADVSEEQADWIYEIPNPLPFRGTTYIGRAWAARAAGQPGSISLPAAPEVSMLTVLRQGLSHNPADAEKIFRCLPEPVLAALAVNSTDPDDLQELVGLCCELEYDEHGGPLGFKYDADSQGRARPRILRHDLFEALVNNRFLPDAYKRVMVLRPGSQGGSEIVGEWGGRGEPTHVFEYLRRNSYIPWGHYAANMADDAVRYQAGDLTGRDITGLRHVYYQRTYVRLAAALNLALPKARECCPVAELEELRTKILAAISAPAAPALEFDATIWGWNYGFDFSASGYRLHASHQQIHQQFAMVPARVASGAGAGTLPAFACGDLVENFVEQYRLAYHSSFFDDYLQAIRNNQRLDGLPDAASSLIVYEDEQVMLFVPKAQTSQWELQLMATGPVGNILEADRETRASLDRGLLLALQVLAGLGARMVTTIEFSKRLTGPDNGQRLFYSFLPKLPQSMGGFSEAQLRFISGHFPEDFAVACRMQLEKKA